jgi:peptidoglycan/xylan/chitin deacetylase (PgdA/CDA1 family)
MIRALLRVAAERALGGGLVQRRLESERSGQILVLAFHNIVPDDAPATGDGSLHLRESRFVELLDRLLEIAQAVELPAGPPPADQGESPALRFAVTFDDAYRGALTLGLPALVRLGIPATVFVPTAMMDDRDFWWDALAGEAGVLDDDLRRVFLDECAGEDAAVRARARDLGLRIRVMPALWRSATVAELRAAGTLPGVSFAAHTARHVALDRLPVSDLERELREPLAWLADQDLPRRPALAYPYGRWSPAVRSAALAAGYESCWRVEGGWLAAGASPGALPRLNVPAGASPRNMLLRAAGWIRT